MTTQTDRERLIETIMAKIHDLLGKAGPEDVADAVLAAGWSLPKPEAEDKETARSIALKHHANSKSTLADDVAAALAAARARVMASVDDSETARRVVSDWYCGNGEDGTELGASEIALLECHVARALSAVRAQMQKRVDELERRYNSAHALHQAAAAQATAAEAALERARAAAELCKLQPGPPKTNYEAGVREGIAIVCSAIQAAEMNASAALDPPTC